MPRSPDRRTAALVVLAVSLAGCSLGDGGSASKAGAPAAPSAAGGTRTVRYASGDPGAAQNTFFKELALASGGRLRAAPVKYDADATDIDQRIARDVAGGKLDIADVGARAWESVGVTGLRAFQSPFLLTSDALLDRALSDPRVTKPLLESLAPL
jgi:hypothetical protein